MLLARAAAIIPGDRSTPVRCCTCVPERRAGKPGSAAEVEHRAELGRGESARARATASSRRSRAAIGEAFHKGAVEARRVLIEQGPHVGGRHRACEVGRAEPGEMERGAVAVPRIEP